MAATISINTVASGEILNQIETSVLLELHERVTIATLLNNAEAWVLSKQDTMEIEQTEINCLKNIIKLTTKTPTPAITL